MAALQSRLGGDLCAGMPWLPPEHFEAPQGMLERPTGCQNPRRCAAARVCLMAQAIEQGAHQSHGLRERRAAQAFTCARCGAEFWSFENLKQFCDDCKGAEAAEVEPELEAA